MTRQAHPPARDRWVVLLEQAAPWIVGGLVLGMAVLWLFAAFLGASRVAG